jgi:hypothetical protein
MKMGQSDLAGDFHVFGRWFFFRTVAPYLISLKVKRH